MPLREPRRSTRFFSKFVALPFPASRVCLSFSRQRRLSRRAVRFDRIININPWEVIAQRPTQHTQRIRHTRSSVSYSSSRPHSGIGCVLLPSTVASSSSSQNFVPFSPQMASPLARSLTRELARSLLKRNLRGSLRKYLLHHCNHNCSSHLHYVDG